PSSRERTSIRPKARLREGLVPQRGRPNRKSALRSVALPRRKNPCKPWVYCGAVAPPHRRLAMSDTILAVDLGRHKSVACAYRPATREATFRAVDTTPEEFTRLLARHPGAVVVIEACAGAGWVHDLAAAARHPVRVANVAAEAWKFRHLKRKTDRDDALRLAELEAIGQLPTVTLPDPATRQRRGRQRPPPARGRPPAA